MSDFFVGEIKMFGLNFAPVNFAFCNGALLSIADNETLYVLIGTTYGGDGQNTFALPDFRSRVPVSQGQGSGLSSYALGQLGGVESVTLISTQMPAHNHALVANNIQGSIDVPNATAMPAQAVQAVGGGSAVLYANTGTAPVTPQAMLTQAVGVTGGSLAHSNLMPSLAVTFVIALFGIFPTRN